MSLQAVDSQAPRNLADLALLFLPPRTLKFGVSWLAGSTHAIKTAKGWSA